MSEIISWIDAYNSEHVLTKLRGMEGRHMPPVSFISDQIPLQSGSRFRDVVVNDREISFPIVILGKGEISLRDNIRAYLPFLDPNRGEGRLRITYSDGGQREIYCRYAGGMELSESADTRLWNQYQEAVLVFHAFDPFWYSTQDNIFTYTTGAQVATFFPFFPLRLSSSTVFADVSLTNSGDVEAWPEWIITGPGDFIVLRNLTTGEAITLSATLGAGEQITINTKPGKKTVKKNDGTNLFGSLSFDSSLWALQPGNNSIRIEVSSTTTASSVQLSYRNRYLGA